MRLGTIMRKWRIVEEHSLRDIAQIIGCSASTLMRFENGEGCDAATFAKILRWLMEQEPR